MKRKILSLATAGLLSLVTISSSAYAAHQTVKFGASWDYGTNSTRTTAYSNVTSTSHWHSSSVTHNDDSDASGWIKPGKVSNASISIMPWSTDIHYYYNIK
ncbi:hypothetical protein Z959_02135 [Clostridium novyi B str. ATCC 27606]|uniref:Bacteriocin n=1 Tax=Clostridium novyi B str. ATCC 27606 TaxID=1443123 RepID=A0AA40IST6_CLONO|nr:lactococcin 972 family bacteriocin [Clostridium novyi]KEI13846.1 hypothetical protein Z959_02135 [Clostridium novyi B str. ATCC 27606]KEI14713.1 hypothetical protein Z958_09780 [Clostridium novyi B str. NCTC 9691]